MWTVWRCSSKPFRGAQISRADPVRRMAAKTAAGFVNTLLTLLLLPAVGPVFGPLDGFGRQGVSTVVRR